MARALFEADSFVVRPPAVLAREQAICLEAISLCMRSILLALNAVKQSTIDFEPSKDNVVSEDKRVLLFFGLWGVVDQLHMLRNLLVRFAPGPRSKIVQSFVDDWEVASTVRNKMDHLHTNLPNLAESKAKRPTTFGALSYFRADQPKINGRVVAGRIITIPLGSISHAPLEFHAVNPAGRAITLPIDLFQFSAFDSRLPIYKLFDAIPALANHLDAELRDQLPKMAENLSAKTGEPIEKLMVQAHFQTHSLIIALTDTPADTRISGKLGMQS